MRSRPAIVVYLAPNAPSPGQTLRATVELHSKSETPYDAIDIFLSGQESRYKQTVSTGQTTSADYHEHEHVRLIHRVPRGVLGVGVSRHVVDFNLPDFLPPTYKSELCSIKYELGVHVHIPWWPDRHETYVVPIRIAPRQTSVGKPLAFTSAQGDQRGDEPIIELSVEDTVLPPGGNVGGAIAFSGLGNKRLRHVELALSCIETALVLSAAGPTEVNRRIWKIFDGTPEDGVAIPFRIGIPQQIVPTFQSSFIRIDYALEVVAVVAFGKDMTLRAPMVVERLRAQPQRSAALPLVGKMRHLSVWRATVDSLKNKLQVVEFDPERASLGLDIDGIRVNVTEENREKMGACLVAELNYASMGLGLRLCERRWIDFGAKIPEMDRELSQRFTAQARDAQQVTMLLDAELRQLLEIFDEAALDDELSVVVQKGGVYRVSGLERFIYRVHALAIYLKGAMKKIPPPSALAENLGAYRQFATERGAKLCVGNLSLTSIFCGGLTLSLSQVFEGTIPRESLLLTALPPAQIEKGLPAGFLESLRGATGHEGVFIDGSVGIRLPLVQDPTVHLQTMETLAACVGMLVGTGKLGPYR